MKRMRNKKGRFIKGHGKVRRRTKRKAARRSGSSSSKRRAKRRNPGMPIMLVNPSHGGKRRRGRRSSGSSSRTTRRSSRRTRRHVRRNPSVSWERAGMAVGLGALGGGVMAGVSYGIDMLPWSSVAKLLTMAGTGIVASLTAAKFADERLGAGAAGATTFSIIQRGTEAYALSAMAKKTDGATTTADNGQQAEGAGVVVRVDAGAPVRQVGARSMAPEGMPSPSFREAGAVYAESGAVIRSAHDTRRRDAGASTFVEGPALRLFGPRSWAYGYTGARSAHNSR